MASGSARASRTVDRTKGSWWRLFAALLRRIRRRFSSLSPDRRNLSVSGRSGLRRQERGQAATDVRGRAALDGGRAGRRRRIDRARARARFRSFQHPRTRAGLYWQRRGSGAGGTARSRRRITMAARTKAAVLAGDIGGTKTLLGLYRVEGGVPTLLREKLYTTRDFKALEEVTRDFLTSASAIDAACFGVPGPIIGGVSHATNVPWTMEEGALARALGVPGARLINDLEATAYGMLQLEDSEIALLQRGDPPATRTPIAVIAAGTGLGEAALVPLEDGRWRSVASEGGHSDFAPRGREQIE